MSAGPKSVTRTEIRFLPVRSPDDIEAQRARNAALGEARTPSLEEAGVWGVYHGSRLLHVRRPDIARHPAQPHALLCARNLRADSCRMRRPRRRCRTCEQALVALGQLLLRMWSVSQAQDVQFDPVAVLRVARRVVPT